MEKYNGWTNWETWKTNLELIDDLDIDLVKDVLDSNRIDLSLDNKEEIIETLAEYFQEYVQEFVEEFDDNIFVSNILDNFLREVDWEEIAENYIENLDLED